MSVATADTVSGLIRWHYGWYAGAAFAVMVVAITAGNLWFLNFVHVFCALLWTGIDLFLGFVLGPIMRRLDPDRHAQIGGDPHLDRHLDAAHGPPQHNVIARELDHAHAPIRGPVSDRKPNRESERVEPLVAARPGRKGHAGCYLTPQVMLPAGLSPVRFVRRKLVPPVVAANMPQTLRNPLNVPG